MKKSGGPEQSGQSDSEEAESEAEDEDFEISQKDSCVSWAVINSLTVGELKAVCSEFLPAAEVKCIPKTKMLLSSFLVADAIDTQQFSAFLGAYRQAKQKPARGNAGPTKAGELSVLAGQMLLVSVKPGRFNGGRSPGKWYIAASVPTHAQVPSTEHPNEEEVHAWNTHHKGILFNRVFHPSWTDATDGKETFQSTCPSSTFAATLFNIAQRQILDRFALENGRIPLCTISRWKLE